VLIWVWAKPGEDDLEVTVSPSFVDLYAASATWGEEAKAIHHQAMCRWMENDLCLFHVTGDICWSKVAGKVVSYEDT
jgi:hypothetical protein